MRSEEGEGAPPMKTLTRFGAARPVPLSRRERVFHAVSLSRR